MKHLADKTFSRLRTSYGIKMTLLAATVWAVSCPADLAAAKTLKEPETGQRFQARRPFKGKAHICLGVGVREFLIFDVYAAGLYVERDRATAAFKGFLGRHGSKFQSSGGFNKGKLQRSAKVRDWLIWATFSRVMEMIFVRDVPGKKSLEVFEKGLRNNLGDLTAPDVKKDVKTFLDRANTDITKGDRMVVSFSGKGRVTVKITGQAPVRINNPKVARAIMKLWLGRRPISETLRDSLLSRIPLLVKAVKP